MNTWVQVIELILIYRSKIAFTSPVNSSKLAPKVATKQKRSRNVSCGFFYARRDPSSSLALKDIGKGQFY
jgi:hypothetical protein